MSKLKPCFKCESENIKIIELYIRQRVNVYTIKCNDCNLNSDYFETKQEAIDWWNDRPSPWVSVKDRLPERSKKNPHVSSRVWVACASLYENLTGRAHYDFYEKRWYDSEGYRLYVYAWCLLPELPEDM